MDNNREKKILKTLGKELYGWIFNDLKLNGNQALVYAALYVTKELCLNTHEQEIVSEYLNICSGTYYNVREKLIKAGLIEVTYDESKGGDFIYVNNPDVVRDNKSLPRADSDVAGEPSCEPVVANRSEMPAMINSTESATDVSVKDDKPDDASRLNFLGGTSDAVNSVLTEKRSSTRPGDTESDSVAVVSEQIDATNSVVVLSTPGNEHTQQPENTPLPGDKSVSQPSPITKEEFCRIHNVKYDGTENTDGIDWDILNQKFGHSMGLRLHEYFRILKNICDELDPIYSDYWSDKEVKYRHDNNIPHQFKNPLSE